MNYRGIERSGQRERWADTIQVVCVLLVMGRGVDDYYADDFRGPSSDNMFAQGRESIVDRGVARKQWDFTGCDFRAMGIFDWINERQPLSGEF